MGGAAGSTSPLLTWWQIKMNCSLIHAFFNSSSFMSYLWKLSTTFLWCCVVGTFKFNLKLCLKIKKKSLRQKNICQVLANFCYSCLLAAFGLFWLHLANVGYFLLLLATFGYFWLLAKTSKDIPKCPKMSQNVLKCPKMSQNVSKHPKTSQNA